MIKTSNYMLTEDVTVGEAQLPSGSFVRPIKIEYIPKHVIDDPRWSYFDNLVHIFCHTKCGILPIQREFLRET
jgi:hypothetical protein